MLSKFSVKKPYTVVVGVVLILILGFVSFTSMTTDLLPNINLPYAMIMTTYQGASPETVEEVVTRPLEQAMATVSNIEEVQSVSSENMSMVILQFAQTTDMDSVSIEMRENIDQISGYWNDSVGKPVIMKLNPEMMPVMVAAVQKDGLEGPDITDYVEKEVISDMESLEGVASVSTSGAIEQSVQVVIRQDKIDVMNQKVQNALDGKFGDAQAELDDAKEQLEDGKSQLEGGKKELENQLSQASGAQAEIARGEAQIEQAQAELTAREQELASARIQLETQKNQLASGILPNDEMYQSAYDQAYATALEAAYAQAEPEIEAQAEEQTAAVLDAQARVQAEIQAEKQVSEQYDSRIAEITKKITELSVQENPDEAALAELEAELQTLTDRRKADKEQAVSEIKEQIIANTPEADREKIKEPIRKLITSQVKQKVEEKVKEEFTRQFNAQYRQQALGVVQGYLDQMDEGQAQIDSAKAQLAAIKAQLTQGKISLAQAQSQIESAKIEATIQMAAAQAGPASGEAQLEQGQKELDQAKEDALDSADLGKTITSDMVSQILMAENFSMPAGYIAEAGVDYLVRVGDEFKATQDIENMVLFDMDIDGLEPIRLRDVADVAVTDNSSEVYAAINGQPGVLLTIQKQTGYSTGDVSNRIKDFFAASMEEESGLHITQLMDQGIYIDMIVNSVLQNLLMGGILAIIILFFFLKDIKPTAVIACSIPISVMTAIVLMYFSGVTLNIISLSGLALGVGMLVDNSVVVIENIYRLRNLGIPARKAAMEGARQVAGAITASTLTTVCVFLPIVFTEGITRQLFVDMGLTIAYSLLASLFIALTLVPMMSAGLLKNTKAKEHKLFDRAMESYEKALRLVLNHKVWTLTGVVAVFAISLVLALRNGTAFMPQMESTQMSLTATLDETATVADTGEIADEIANRLMTYEDVTDVGAMVGGSGGGMMNFGSGSDNQATVYILLDEKKKQTNEALAIQIEEDLADLNCEISVESSSMDMSALGGSGISVEIKGKDMDTLQETARLVAEKIETVEGTRDVSDGMEDTTNELRVIVKKGEAMRHNLTVAQVYQQLAAKIAAEKKSTTLSTDTKDYPVAIVNGAKTTFSREDVKKMTITATDRQGKTEEIPLSDLADFEEAEGPQAINRHAQSRCITVTAGVDEGYNIGLVGADVNEAMKTLTLPAGYTAEMTGEDETINEAMVEVFKMMALAIVFMYLIMVAQFQSLLSPFIVMFTIPLAFTGGLLGLVIAGAEVSVIALIGFVMLAGIIVNNGIVLVDYINQLRGGGMDKREALVEAGKTRMRPILMTALTTILGLSTMAIGMGMGSDMVQPMAIVTIGGLIYGTLLTLFVVPCIYDVLNRKEYHNPDEKEALQEAAGQEESGTV